MPNLFDDFDLDVKKVLISNSGISPRACDPSGDSGGGGKTSTCLPTENESKACLLSVVITKGGACC